MSASRHRAGARHRRPRRTVPLRRPESPPRPRKARPAHNQHPELRRHDVEPLDDILADPVQRAATAGADRAVDIDHRLDPWQMGR